MINPPPQSITILHLEDNSLDAELTCEIFSGANITCHMLRVMRLEEFQAALEQYPERRQFDLILADYNMPGFDGMTALRMTRDIDLDIPFILLSGALGEELAVELLRNGATDYVLKNNMQRLPLVVTRAIEEFQVRQREKQSQAEIRQARDEAQNANSAKGRFLGRISHELRTPLNAIIGYTQLMQSDPMSEEQTHCTEQILRAGEHLLQLINEVLDITRIESGVISVKLQPTSIIPIIERAVDLVRPMARDAGVTIHIDGGPCNLYAYVDKDRLTQVLINFLSNGVKYNNPGGHVYVECDEEEHNFVKLLVRDTGIGISPSKIERLFTPFDRLDLEVNSSIPGTGLGLTVSKALVENMGGTLGVVSSVDDGCIFWLQVPKAGNIEANTGDSEPIPVATETPAFPAQCKVLLVEEHGGAADFMERAFRRRANINLLLAATYENALELMEKEKPQAVVMELNLYGKIGEEFIKALKAHPTLSKVPIVILTTDGSAERQRQVLDLGVFDYFTKPVKMDKFLHTLVRACSEGTVNE